MMMKRLRPCTALQGKDVDWRGVVGVNRKVGGRRLKVSRTHVTPRQRCSSNLPTPSWQRTTVFTCCGRTKGRAATTSRSLWLVAPAQKRQPEKRRNESSPDCGQRVAPSPRQGKAGKSSCGKSLFCSFLFFISFLEMLFVFFFVDITQTDTPSLESLRERVDPCPPHASHALSLCPAMSTKKRQGPPLLTIQYHTLL